MQRYYMPIKIQKKFLFFFHFPKGNTTFAREMENSTITIEDIAMMKMKKYSKNEQKMLSLMILYIFNINELFMSKIFLNTHTHILY